MSEEIKTITPETSKPEEKTLSPEDQEMYNLDVCFIIDTTGSMQPSINMARNKIKEILEGLKSQYSESEVRIAIVSYKDNGDHNQHQVFNFNTSVDEAHTFLYQLHASGGGDHPEDVNGGFRHVLKLDWKKLTTKMLYHLADAPCHGRRFHNSGDSYPDGLPGDEKWEDILKKVYDMDINYLFYDIGGSNKMMYDEFKKIFESSGEEKSHLIFSYEVMKIDTSSHFMGGSLTSTTCAMPSYGMSIPTSYPSSLSSCSMMPTMDIASEYPSSMSIPHSDLFDMGFESTKDDCKNSKPKAENKASKHEEQFVFSTVSNAQAQMVRNISYQQAKLKKVEF